MEPILPETPKAGKDPFDVEQFALLHLVGCAIGVGVDVGIKKNIHKTTSHGDNPLPPHPLPFQFLPMIGDVKVQKLNEPQQAKYYAYTCLHYTGQSRNVNMNRLKDHLNGRAEYGSNSSSRILWSF